MTAYSRKYTNHVLNLVDDEVISKDWLVVALLNWMSEREVEQFYNKVLLSDMGIERNEYHSSIAKV